MENIIPHGNIHDEEVHCRHVLQSAVYYLVSFSIRAHIFIRRSRKRNPAMAYSEFDGHWLSLSLPDIATFKRCTLFFLGCSHGEEVEVVV